MKLMTVLLCAFLLMGVLTGCNRSGQKPTESTPTISTPAATQPSSTGNAGSTEKGDSVAILENIWALYGEDERFAVYGGAVENSVADAPGALDLSNAEELVSKYLIPQNQLTNISDGASLVHMMNGNIFTAVVFKVQEGTNVDAMTKAWRDAIHQNRWICGQPDKMLMYRMDTDHILMTFGSADAMTQFQGKVTAAFADAKTIYSEAIVG